MFNLVDPFVAMINNPMTGDLLIINAGKYQLSSGFYTIGIRKNILPGAYTYQFGNSSDLTHFAYYPNSQTAYGADHGTFQVLSNDTIAKRIEFKFQFDIYSPSDTIHVTQGHIIASY